MNTWLSAKYGRFEFDKSLVDAYCIKAEVIAIVSKSLFYLNNKAIYNKYYQLNMLQSPLTKL